MAYIGTGPENKGIGLFSQDTFTGDGSTTTFDMSNAAPDGGGNDIQVFIDNVRQQEGSSNAYTLGLDGSSELKRITFTTAPASSASIFVLNPGTKNTQSIQSVSDNTVSAAKIQSDAVIAAKIQADAVTTAKILDANVTRAKLEADAIDATKLADDAISEEHLDVTAITGHTELSEKAASNDVILVFDTSASALKKVQRSNFTVTPTTVTSISPTTVQEGDGTGNHTFTITGTGFTGGSAKFINASGVTVNFDTVTVNSATQITGVIAKSSLPGSGEPYDIQTSSIDNLTATLEDQVSVNQSPAFVTAAGSLGTVSASALTGKRFTVVATDPESAGNVTFEKQSGTIPPGLTLSNEGSEGGTAVLSGNITEVANNTTFNFVLRAIDAASNTSSRAFSITVNAPTFKVFNSSGTFTVPTGVSQVDALVVAGGGHGGYQHSGGGGAGGLIFMPNYPVTPGGTIAVTVGCGGTPSGGSSPGFPNMTGQDSVFGSPGNPGLGSGGVLTAKGGGVGQSGCSAGPNGDGPVTAGAGGSGGGAGYQSTNAGGGAGTQPTQPGNSGAYGFGNVGGTVTGSGGNRAGAGGGGAGAAGGNSTNANGADGGVGKAYTIADGTTPVFYAGGGGGSNHASPSVGGNGGQGGGGNAGVGPKGQNGAPPGNATNAQDGQANKGGGGGSAHYAGQQDNFAQAPAGLNQGNGGKGVVIVRWA